MSFTLIKGTFAPSLGRTDGDSLRFIPDDPQPIYRLRRRQSEPSINPENGSIQLRYEGIDSLEAAASQPNASEATASNFELAGTHGGADRARGYLLSNQLGPQGRPIAFAFAGDTPEPDGSDIIVDANRIMDSINVQQLVRGLAYPLFYDTLFDDLRARLRQVAITARENKLGLWPHEKTMQGVTYNDDLSALPPIYPKLWRRLDSFRRDETMYDAARPLVNFTTWIARERPERVTVPGANVFTGFDNLVETTTDTLRMSVDPLDLIIVSAI